MFYLSRIAATSPSSVAGMTKHLMNATLAADRNMEAFEFSRGSSIEHDWHRLAAAVLDGDLKRSEAIAELMQPWLRTANYGTPKVWDHANIVQAQIEDRFDALTERVGDGTAFAPLAILRPDTEAGVSRALGILPGMLLDTDRTLQRGIMLRNPYIDPMHFMQVDLLERWRSGGRQSRELLEALQASVGGIARGLQTTG